MIEITMKIPRLIYKNTKYVGDANVFINQPIIINEKVIGVVSSIISSDDNYIEIEGYLFNAGANYFTEPEMKPCSIEIHFKGE